MYLKSTKLYTEKTVSLIYGQRKNVFKLKKVLLIEKNRFVYIKEFFFELTRLSSI